MTALIEVPLALHARLSNDGELAVFIEAGRQLADWLTLGAGNSVALRITRGDSLRVGAADDPAHVNLVSMLDAISETRHDFATIEARWQAELEFFYSRSTGPIFICTAFRHVPEGDAKQRTLERIRRVNLMIARLSQKHGIGVIDIDRIFAHFGARALHTDYRLDGPVAAKAAGEVIVDALLSEGLDEFFGPELLTRVRALRGDRAQSFKRIEASIASARGPSVAAP